VLGAFVALHNDNRSTSVYWLLQRCVKSLVLVLATVGVYRLLIQGLEVVLRLQCTLASISLKYRLYAEPLELWAPVDRVAWSRETVHTSQARTQIQMRAI
jgi:hypothetical protein